MGTKIHINLRRTLKGHHRGLYGLSIFKQTSLLSAGGDGMLVAWQALESDDGTLLAQIPEPVYALAALGETILCGSNSGHLYAVRQGENPRKYQHHKAAIFCIEILDNGHFITGAADGTAVIWNREMELVKEQKISMRSVRKIEKIPHGFALACSDHAIYIADENLRVLQVLDGHTASVFALAYIPNTGKLISGGRDALLHVWDMNSGILHAKINAHWYHVNDLKLSPDGSFLASASMDKTIKMWDPNSMELMKVMDAQKFGAHISSVNRLLWLNNHVLASASDDRTVGIWEINEDF